MTTFVDDIDTAETKEWLQAIESLNEADGPARVQFMLDQLATRASTFGVNDAASFNTPYVNSITSSAEPDYPGDEAMEQRIDALIRWNTAVMVTKTNQQDGSLGGHIGTFTSIATIYGVGFMHFFRAYQQDNPGDLVFFQGHSSPGIYARSFLEGRLSKDQLTHFRREVGGKGIASYPHPWLMPDYWQFATVSMGLGPMQAIYQARFMKYLACRGLSDTSDRHVWAFCGDGEMDEPESMGAITRAGREKLDNLTLVVNCNLQRLDGLVHGNGQIIQELESSFRGAKWRVIKVLWSTEWEALFAKDKDGLIIKRLSELNDGEMQLCRARGPAFSREYIFGQSEALKALVADYSDEALFSLRRGGHDPRKLFAAFQAAKAHKGQPTLILTFTVKGFGMGEGADSKNTAHNQKKLSVEALTHFRDFFNIPVSDEDVKNMSLYRPKDDSPEILYLTAKRKALGGAFPKRMVNNTVFSVPDYTQYAASLLAGTKAGHTLSTTTAFVRILNALCKDKAMGQYVVPITPDESRTFGMEGLFRQLGIYNASGQNYEPEDKSQVMYYREAADGQILQEGINEGGAISAWIAAATSYSAHLTPMIPFYIFYSMFGFQRVADYIWAAADMRARGFLLGATAGRTTLNGEGLQHEDGHSHLFAQTIPNCLSYDPTYAYELAVIIDDGLHRMFANHEDIFYYITVMNENYSQRPMPKGVESGIKKGLYLLEKGPSVSPKKVVQLIGSGAILREVEAAATLLFEDFNICADVWSMTSASELYRDAKAVERENRLNPTKKQKVSYLTSMMNKTTGPIIAATDYLKLYSDQLREFMPRHYVTLGTDGFGRSDTREALRAFFEVDRHMIAYTAIKALHDEGTIDEKTLKAAHKKYAIQSNKPNPLSV